MSTLLISADDQSPSASNLCVQLRPPLQYGTIPDTKLDSSAVIKDAVLESDGRKQKLSLINSRRIAQYSNPIHAATITCVHAGMLRTTTAYRQMNKEIAHS